MDDVTYEYSKNLTAQLQSIKFSDPLRDPKSLIAAHPRWSAQSRVGKDLLRWHNKRAVQRIDELIEIYQVESPEIPNEMKIHRTESTSGTDDDDSLVTFTKRHLKKSSILSYIHRIQIHNRAYYHTDPAEHADFYFVTIKYDVPAWARTKIFISDSISYYHLGKELTAGCHFYGASVATLALVIKICTGILTPEEAKAEYSRLIGILAAENTNAENRYYETNRRNQQDYFLSILETTAYERYISDSVKRYTS